MLWRCADREMGYVALSENDPREKGSDLIADVQWDHSLCF